MKALSKFWTLLLIFVSIMLLGCGPAKNSLHRPALQYYEFTLGLRPKLKYSRFLSPAFVQGVPKETIEKLNNSFGKAKKPNVHAVSPEPEMVKVVDDGRFGISRLERGSGSSMPSQPPVRWVRDGRKWFLFMASDAEVRKYGNFPVTLVLPATEERSGRKDPDAPQ